MEPMTPVRKTNKAKIKPPHSNNVLLESPSAVVLGLVGRGVFGLVCPLPLPLPIEGMSDVPPVVGGT